MQDVKLQPPKGFRDLYPDDKVIQDSIFSKLIKVAQIFGFENYDGPILENKNIYLEKTSQELIDRQTFQIKTKNKETLVLRPEMTPSLARMIAKKANELTFPLKLFNLGLRFRYEMPQKGREREFYQADYDILGTTSILADAEILNVAAQIFLSFGASEKDFIIYINSRSEMENNLSDLGFATNQFKLLLNIIDKQDKISNEKFTSLLLTIEKDKNKIKKLINFLFTAKKELSPYFQKLFSTLEKLGVKKFCEINYNITRGLDYYTGLVFEVREQGAFQLKRSLLGGGRYDNLISDFNPDLKIPGVGFATSDVVIWQFLTEKKLLPQLNSTPSKVLITIFDEKTISNSLEVLNFLRKNQMPSEIYFETKKLDKQLKYADKKGVPYVVIIGPDEAKKNVVKLKNMKTGEQKELKIEEILSVIR